MLNVAVLSFVLTAVAIALLVVRSDSRRRAQPWSQGPRRSAHQTPQRTVRTPTMSPLDLAPSEPRAHRSATAIVVPLRRGLSTASDALLKRMRPYALFLGAAAGVLLLVVLLVVSIATRDVAPLDAPAPEAARPGARTVATASVTAATTPAQATSAPAVAAGMVGAPLSGDALLRAWTSSGLAIEPASERLGCASDQQRSYRVRGSSGAGQLATVFVYASPEALSQEWAVDRGSPLHTRTSASCPPAEAVTYWNQNVVVVFPQTTDPAARQAMSDALLRLSP